MGKFSSILLGTISGAAVAYFLTSKKGQEVTAKVTDFIKDVQANPEDFRDQVFQTANDFTNQAVERVSEVKEKVATGQITGETVLTSVKEQAQAALNLSPDKFQGIKDKLQEENIGRDDLLASIQEQAQALEEKVHFLQSEDIVIDLDEKEKD
ncbi:YtxH domain-containing protein [Streptococcus oricebi]|uniref:YtxH domain-containing protein n=1 Tax=Streptococcus oricebi TaxID=1547447 RepID=A0ABS5B272_9STRE|nr:YtxH domain-containing protein [Streptococcus oricebi]MBP2622937.1 YtxH domain-containing protein [Streptococcus oricebi]